MFCCVSVVCSVVVFELLLLCAYNQQTNTSPVEPVCFRGVDVLLCCYVDSVVDLVILDWGKPPNNIPPVVAFRS